MFVASELNSPEFKHISFKDTTVPIMINILRQFYKYMFEQFNLIFSLQMIQTIKTLIENANSVYEKIVQCQKAAMEFHENLHNIGAKEGLKERKLQKAVESFTWNITILKGQADLLKYAKNETFENLKQIHYAALSCGLNKPGTENAEVSKPRRSLEAIPEKSSDEIGE
ncbi:inactive phospholipase C-like protein 2 [Chrysemys picta bellii]|uniref:inactive phospholipase C-like protein 2 n=1 Tax=Chrysemys picta bellii TaxID=8478 RepID=UPI0032B2254C